MKKKKVLFSITAVLMLVMCISAFAAGGGKSTVVTGNCKIPNVQVAVPSTASLIINPKKLSVSVGGKLTADGIVSSPAYIMNGSQVPIQINVTATCKINTRSDMYLTSESTKGQGLTSKCAFIYFEMQPTDAPGQTVPWDSGYDEEKHLLIYEGENSRENFAVLAPYGKSGCYGNFRLTGDCVADPDSKWTTRDGLSVKIAYTFRPLPLK